MARPIKKAGEVRTRHELDKRLRDQGTDGQLFQSDAHREAAAWCNKKIRQGKDDFTIDPRELGIAR